VHRFAQDIDSGFQILQLEFTALFAYLRISSHIFATEVYTKAPLWNILLAIFPPVGVRAAAFAAKPVAFVAFVALDLGQILGHPWPLSVETCRQKPWIIVADCGKNSSTDPRPCCTYIVVQVVKVVQVFLKYLQPTYSGLDDLN
jgi:hypothetical protein